ncbi:MAG: HVO_0476 family zinc finger protein [Methanofollis sp.]|nr:HVO_0476 family zinc finger protein [Methanofollis sp.]
MYITVVCPQCEDETNHEVLKEAPGDLLVRCTVCGATYHIPVPKERLLNVKAIVSMEDQSLVGSVELLEDDLVSVGDTLVAESGDGEEVVSVEVTSIEVGDHRVGQAKASEISALWTRVIEEVIVKASVHHGAKTIPLYKQCEGEEPFVVDEVYTFGNVRFRISHIKMRTGQMLRKEGWKTVAKKIKRIYGNKM